MACSAMAVAVFLNPGVGRIERMTVFAMILSTVKTSTKIFFARYRLQMVRIDA
jgi:hypothetical protein